MHAGITMTIIAVDVPRGAGFPRKRLRGTRSQRKRQRAKLYGKRVSVEVLHDVYRLGGGLEDVVTVRTAGAVTVEEFNAELRRTSSATGITAVHSR